MGEHGDRRVAVEERRTAAQLERRRVEARLEDVLAERAGAEEELADAAEARGGRRRSTGCVVRPSALPSAARPRRAWRRRSEPRSSTSLPGRPRGARVGAGCRRRGDRCPAARAPAPLGGERLSLGTERAPALLADVGVELAAAEEAATLQPARREEEATGGYSGPAKPYPRGHTDREREVARGRLRGAGPRSRRA